MGWFGAYDYQSKHKRVRIYPFLHIPWLSLPSTLRFLVAEGIRTVIPSKSWFISTWQPSRDLGVKSIRQKFHGNDQGEGGVNLRICQSKCQIQHIIFFIRGFFHFIIVVLITNDMTRWASQGSFTSTLTSQWVTANHQHCLLTFKFNIVSLGQIQHSIAFCCLDLDSLTFRSDKVHCIRTRKKDQLIRKPNFPSAPLPITTRDTRFTM